MTLKNLSGTQQKAFIYIKKMSFNLQYGEYNLHK